MAAVLACRDGAVLSHLDAAALHDLRQVGSGAVNVTATGRHEARGIRYHWARTLEAQDCTIVDGIPVTSVARTYLDLAELLSPNRLIDLLEAGQRQDKLDVGAIKAVVARNPGRHGIKPLQVALAQLADDPPLLQSHLERAFRALIRDHGLPEPHYNAYVEDELVDAVWPHHRLVVEVDGWNYHRTKRSFKNDRRRDRKLLRAHWRAARFTGGEVAYETAAVAAELSELLRDGPWPPPARSGP
jgi:very-short-patch-repair endonuclease